MSYLAFTVLCIHKQLRQLLKGIKKDKISQMPVQTPQRKTLCSITIGVAMITYTHYTACILKCNSVKIESVFWTRMVWPSRTALFTLVCPREYNKMGKGQPPWTHSFHSKDTWNFLKSNFLIHVYGLKTNNVIQNFNHIFLVQVLEAIHDRHQGAAEGMEKMESPSTDALWLWASARTNPMSQASRRCEWGWGNASPR